MPWTTGDVTRFTKKATTKKLKERWVVTANSILKRTGDEQQAIRVANNVVRNLAKKAKGAAVVGLLLLGAQACASTHQVKVPECPPPKEVKVKVWAPPDVVLPDEPAQATESITPEQARQTPAAWIRATVGDLIRSTAYGRKLRALILAMLEKGAPNEPRQPQ